MGMREAKKTRSQYQTHRGEQDRGTKKTRATRDGPTKGGGRGQQYYLNERMETVYGKTTSQHVQSRSKEKKKNRSGDEEGGSTV